MKPTAPPELYAITCGECRRFIAAEDSRQTAKLWRPLACPASHSKRCTVITGPYVLAPKKRSRP